FPSRRSSDLILGHYSSFEEIEANQRSWRFVRKGHVFSDPAQPWGFPESEGFDPFDKSAANIDFSGVKIGDVDGNSSAARGFANEARDSEFLVLQASAGQFERGELVRIAVSSPEFEDILGYQYTLKFAAEKLRFTGVESGAINLRDEHINAKTSAEGVLTTSWHQTDAFSSPEVLYTYVFEAMESFKL